MSRASKLTLLGTSLSAIALVAGVHYQQVYDKAVMHQGVIRDMEQQKVKKERQADFDLQRKMEEEYRKIQRVGDGKDPVAGGGGGGNAQG